MKTNEEKTVPENVRTSMELYYWLSCNSLTAIKPQFSTILSDGETNKHETNPF